jgi:ATP-binding cassette subfamily B multidrug efflux pump
VKRIFKYIWKYKILVMVPTMAMLISIVLDMFNPYLSKLMVDNVIIKKDMSLFKPVIAGLVAITLGRVVLGYIKEYLFDYLSSKVSLDLKRDLFNHIQKLPFNYFDSMNTGELMSRINNDVDNIWRAIAFGIRLFVENAIYFVTASVILFYLNWKLACISLITMPIISFIALRLEKEMGENFGKLSDQSAVINTTAQEDIAGVRLVKAFAREKYEVLKFLKLNNRNYDINVEQGVIVSKYFPAIEFLCNVSTILVIILGGVLVIKEGITIGMLVAFNGYVWMMIWPMRMIGWLINMIAQSSASAKKIFEIMDTEPEIKNSDNAIDLKNVQGEIKFENVSFKYNDNYVLEGINLDIKPGSTVAIMGTTGSGKTSIINLIGRYYDVTEGSVLVDNHDVRNIILNDLRSKMAVVSQDTFLFSDTVENNIKFAKEDASDEEVINACKTACAYDFIKELNDGFDTVIGERGIGLSGGQKQRISIARALIRPASILILDDATSALDMETEYNLLKNLYHRENKITTFIIAHRISAVKNADEIIFLDNGIICERGTHKDLLKLKGKYFEIYNEQFSDFLDEEEVI